MTNIPACNRPMHEFVTRQEKWLTEQLKKPEEIKAPMTEIKVKYALWAYHRCRKALERPPSRVAFHG